MVIEMRRIDVGVDEAKERVVLDPMKIATLEYLKHRIPIDVEPHLDE